MFLFFQPWPSTFNQQYITTKPIDDIWNLPFLFKMIIKRPFNDHNNLTKNSWCSWKFWKCQRFSEKFWKASLLRKYSVIKKEIQANIGVAKLTNSILIKFLGKNLTFCLYVLLIPSKLFWRITRPTRETNLAVSFHASMNFWTVIIHWTLLYDLFSATHKQTKLQNHSKGTRWSINLHC